MGNELEPTDGAPTSAEAFGESLMGVDGGKVYFALDGWYFEPADGSPRRVTISDVAKLTSRAFVFKQTRVYIAYVSRELADSAWISTEDTRPEVQTIREKDLDPKTPSEQIADAGDIIGRLGRELSEAEMTY